MINYGLTVSLEVHNSTISYELQKTNRVVHSLASPAYESIVDQINLVLKCS